MIQLSLQERISERIVVLFPQFQGIVFGILRSSFSSVEAYCRLSQTMETFLYHRLWKKSWKRFCENRRLVVGTEIDSLEVEIFSSCVELECGTTPPVPYDSARSHLMNAQLG